MRKVIVVDGPSRARTYEEAPMPQMELTPVQLSMFLDAECTDAERAELTAAVRQFGEAVVDCLVRGDGTGPGLLDGLLMANELQTIRGRFLRGVSRVTAAARRRYLDRTLHDPTNPADVSDARGPVGQRRIPALRG